MAARHSDRSGGDGRGALAAMLEAAIAPQPLTGDESIAQSGHASYLRIEERALGRAGLEIGKRSGDAPAVTCRPPGTTGESAALQGVSLLCPGVDRRGGWGS